MAFEDFYTFSEKLLRKNPEIWYGIAAVAGWVLLSHFYRLLRADPAERKALLKSYGSMALFLLLFALATLGFAAGFTFLPGR
jgi:hypothetical protein